MGTTLTTNAANTYELISTNTVTSSVGTYTLSSIPSTYTDLLLSVSLILSLSDYVTFRLNGDTGANYGGTYLNGNGSGGILSGTVGSFGSGYPYTTGEFHVLNYSNTTTKKQVMFRAGGAGSSGSSQIGTCLYTNGTAAISSITLLSASALFTAGSTFNLYGIKAA
jgi:hypothetical protein